MISRRRSHRDIIVSEASADEVQRALAAYRGYNARRSIAIALRHLHKLIDCPPCLQEYLQPGDDADEVRDQLRDFCERLKLER